VKALLLLIAAMLAVVVAACGGGNGGSADSDTRPRIAATTAIIGALVREVGGDQVRIDVLAPSGVDPHEYELTAENLRQVDQAKVILRNGIGLDAFLDKALKGSQERVVTVTGGITLRHGEGGQPTESDPHVWQNPLNVKVMVDNIAGALAKFDPARADVYSQNAKAYSQRLDDVDGQIQQLMEGIPPASRKMVTNHDAFGYFIERYGLKFVGAVIPSMTTQAEPSAKDIAALEDTIRREGVKAVFAESSIDPKIAQQIAKDTGVKIVDDLYGDTLGKAGSGADTVDGMLLTNARKIAEALR